MWRVVLLALVTSGCLTSQLNTFLEREGLLPAAGVVERPVGRLYPKPLPTHVELVGADASEVWARSLAVLRKYGVKTEPPSFIDGDGNVRLQRVTLTIAGAVNEVDYAPGEVVRAMKDDQKVRLDHALVLHLSSMGSRLVRLWVDGEVTVDGYAPSRVRAPQLFAHALLSEIAEGFPVVREWRIDPPPPATLQAAQ